MSAYDILTRNIATVHGMSYLSMMVNASLHIARTRNMELLVDFVSTFNLTSVDSFIFCAHIVDMVHDGVKSVNYEEVKE